MKEAKTKSGRVVYLPSIEEVREMSENGQGWCLACGNIQDGCEPDARQYTCDDCGCDKVYGAEELALMGMVH